MNSRSFFLSALIAGVAIGLVAHLPLLNIINCFLCLWVWLGGILAVFLYRGFQHGECRLTAGQGAALGALAGLIGAFLGVVVNGITYAISQPIFLELARMLQVGDALPITGGGLAGALRSTFVFFGLDVVTYPLFGALSGLIGASLLRTEPQAPPPADSPPANPA
jgi:hypothetical protein